MKKESAFFAGGLQFFLEMLDLAAEILNHVAKFLQLAILGITGQTALFVFGLVTAEFVHHHFDAVAVLRGFIF
ncbi:MAG: hypothetical protein R3F31_18310 [Verrucomicrobiales bacterium]